MKHTAGTALAVMTTLLGALPFTAHAHVTLETREAPADSYYKAVLRVPHGCKGSPTISVRVQIPDGVTGVKPQPKPGWTVATVKAKLAQPVDNGHGGQITEGVREIVWSGGRLQDEHYDEFAFMARLPKAANTTLYFPVVQECEQGVSRWIDRSGEAKAAEPAPRLRLLPKAQ